MESEPIAAFVPSPTGLPSPFAPPPTNSRPPIRTTFTRHRLTPLARSFVASTTRYQTASPDLSGRPSRRLMGSTFHAIPQSFRTSPRTICAATPTKPREPPLALMAGGPPSLNSYPPKCGSCACLSLLLVGDLSATQGLTYMLPPPSYRNVTTPSQRSTGASPFFQRFTA